MPMNAHRVDPTSLVNSLDDDGLTSCRPEQRWNRKVGDAVECPALSRRPATARVFIIVVANGRVSAPVRQENSSIGKIRKKTLLNL